MTLILAAILAMQDSESEIQKLRAENEQLRVKIAALEALHRLGEPSPVYGAEGKITAVSTKEGLVVFNLGSANGVKEGSNWTVYRDQEYVATIVIARVDRQWSAGKIEKQQSDPRIGDRVAREGTLVIPNKPATIYSKPEANELQEIRKELDELRRQIRELTDKRLPSYQSHGFAAEEIPHELREHLGLKGGLLVRRVEPGSAAEKVGLKAWDALPDLTEAGLIEALNQGRAPKIVRSRK